MASRRDGEDWLRGLPVAGDPEPRDIPEDWRPVPAAVTLVLAVAFTVGTFVIARKSHTLWEHLNVFVVAVALPISALQLMRWLLRRPHPLMQVFAASRLRLALFALPVVLAAAAVVAGLPPEDLALAALPAAMIGDEALIALGIGDPRANASA